MIMWQHYHIAKTLLPHFQTVGIAHDVSQEGGINAVFVPHPIGESDCTLVGYASVAKRFFDSDRVLC